MKEMNDWLKDWNLDEITDLFHIIGSAHKSKNAKKLTEILDEVSELRDLLGTIPIDRIGRLLKKLVDVIAIRTVDEYVDENQEKT